MPLTREQILNADDLPTEVVNVPQWGGSVLIRTLSGAERDAFEASILRSNKKGKQDMNMENLRARLVALCIVDEQGNRLFNKDDIQALGKKSALALALVFTAAQELNGMGPKDVEELAGNSLDDPSDDSISD